VVGAIAQSVQAFALLVGAYIAWRTVRQARAANRTQSTFRYLERITASRMRRIIDRGREIWNLNATDPPMPPPSIWQQLSAWLGLPATPTTPEGADRGPRARALRRYKTASARDQLNIGELFDLYEEVSAVFLRGQLDKQIFVDQVAPELVYYWRQAHWLINYFRELPDGSLDVHVYDKWQTVYVRMIRQNLLYDSVEDSDPDAGDYALLPDQRPWLWPDPVTWP